MIGPNFRESYLANYYVGLESYSVPSVHVVPDHVVFWKSEDVTVAPSKLAPVKSDPIKTTPLTVALLKEAYDRLAFDISAFDMSACEKFAFDMSEFQKVAEYHICE